MPNGGDRGLGGKPHDQMAHGDSSALSDESGRSPLHDPDIRRHESRPNIRIVEERASTALVDGDNAMGHLVMRLAAEIAIARADKAGVAWVGARGSNHAGAGAALRDDAARA